MSKPVFSFIAPAVRSGFYERFYASANLENDIPFEVIFVGDEKPKKKIGKNFHYIYTGVKPAQCWEIAARNATGDYLIVVADDIVLSNNFLHNLENYINIKSDDTFISFRLCIDGVMKDHWFYYGKEKYPIGASGAFEREHWHKIGGIDQRFIYMGWDLDLQFRFRETKDFFVTPDCWIEELRDAHKIKRRASKIVSKEKEVKMLDDLWMDEKGNKSDHRKEKVLSYDDKNILTKSQGNNLPKVWK